MSDGIGCKCAARCAADCVCDADWTPSELAALRTKLEKAERKLAQARAEGMEEAARLCDEVAVNPSSLWEQAGCWAHAAENCAAAIRAKKAQRND